MEESHVVEMRRSGINGDDPPHQTLFSAMQHHPLTEISTSPGHLLLLKLWQRNEELITSRVVTEESRLDAAKREAFQICSAFFFFHGLFFTLLFTSSVGQQSSDLLACRGWWVPSFLSLVTCLVLIISVQASICSYWKIHGKLQRERGDGRALARCVQELRMKGASFDLSKEPQGSLRMKSSSVEIKWRPIKWCSRNAVTIFLLCFSGMVFPACRFILCS